MIVSSDAQRSAAFTRYGTSEHALGQFLFSFRKATAGVAASKLAEYLLLLAKKLVKIPFSFREKSPLCAGRFSHHANNPILIIKRVSQLNIAHF
jgi:hypothetical protein